MAQSDRFDPGFPDVPVKPKVPWQVVVLCLLNVAAAAGFLYVLVLDMHKRQSWSYAVFMYDLHLMGLPLRMETDGLSASRVVLPRPGLSSQQLQKAYKERRSGGPSIGEDKFILFDEPLPARIRAEHLDDTMLKEYFGSDGGPPVKTLEEEIERIKKDLLKDIEQAAREFAEAQKTDADKKQALEKLLLPLASSVQQVRALNKVVLEADPGKLADLLLDAGQRRMLVDLLFALESFRAGDPNNLLTERVADLGKTKIEDLQNQINMRLDNLLTDKYKGEIHQGPAWDGQDRDSVEKRQAIAFMVFAVGHLNRPDGKLLYAKGPERAQLVAGLYEFAYAAQSYTLTLLLQEQRVLDLIRADRQGAEILGNPEKIQRTAGFTEKYPEMIVKLRDLVRKIGAEQTRLQGLKTQNQQAQNLYNDRLKHQLEVTDKLIKERAKTAFLVSQLRLVQGSLFRAQVELSEAAETNFRLERDLRKAESDSITGAAP